MAKSNRNIPVVFYIGLLLVCLTFFSVHMTSGLYARYTTTASGEDSARVAKFEVTSAQQIQTKLVDAIVLRPGQEITYTYAVTNSSEVAVKISVDAKSLMGELPVKVRYEPLTLQPNTDEAVPFTFTVSLDPEKVKDTDLENCYKVDLVQLTVIVQQVD